MFDGRLRISTRKPNVEPRCLTSLGGHDGAICAAKHLELVHVHHLANPYTDLTNFLRGTKHVFRETNTVIRDTDNSLRGTKYFLRETNTIFRDKITPFEEPNISFGVHSYTGFNDAVESYLRKIDHPVPLTDRSIDDLKLLLLKAEKQDMIADKTAKIIAQFLKKSTPFCKVNFQQILFHIVTRFPENQVVWLS